MAGFRKDFAALKMAGGEDSSSDEDDDDISKKMTSRFGGVGKGRAAQGAAFEPEQKGALDALRSQKGAGTWKTTSAAREAAPSGVAGFRVGTNVSTVSGGGAAGAVDAAPKTAFGARMTPATAYVGPATPSKAAPVAKAPYAAPAPLPAGKPLAALLDEVDAFRSDPRAYASTVAKFRPFYDGQTFHCPRGDSTTPRATLEGVEALDELVAYLGEMKATQPLKRIAGLDAAAKDLVDAKAAKAPSPAVRAAVYGLVEGAVVDVVSRKALRADEALLHLLLCDGDKTRRVRRHLADPKLTRGGVSCASGDEATAVLTLATTFRPHPTPGKRTYGGKVPVSDDEFLEVLLALPEPLPSDLLSKIKAGATVEIDWAKTNAKVTATSPDGSSEEIAVDLT